MSDKIAHPSHYEGAHGVECMEAMRNVLDREDGLTGSEKYWTGCALKYLWRWPFKNGLEDLRKSRQCIDYLIAEVRESSARRWERRDEGCCDDGRKD